MHWWPINSVWGRRKISCGIRCLVGRGLLLLQWDPLSCWRAGAPVVVAGQRRRRKPSAASLPGSFCCAMIRWRSLNVWESWGHAPGVE
eukprot:4663869-Pyramimonas_sp.AAC.1